VKRCEGGILVALADPSLEQPLHLTLPGARDTRLRGRWRLLARVGWGALATTFVGLYGASLLQYVAFLQSPCCGTACLIDGALTQETLHVLRQLGLSVDAYTALLVAPYLVRVLLGCIIGVVIAWRRSDDWMALLVALVLLTTAFGNRAAPPDVLPLANAAWRLPVDLGHLLSSTLLYLFFFLFPSGRFVPRSTRWVAAIYFLQQLAELVLPRESPANFENWPFAFGVLFYLPLFLTVLFAQVYRYRSVSTPAQRRQTKWVVFGVVVVAGGLFGASFLLLFFPVLHHMSNLPVLLSALFIMNLSVVLLVCIGVAVLYARLFDIDVIIRRTLVYGTLTVLLAGLYAGLAIGLGGVVRTIFGLSEQQPLIIVVSTLAVAALVQPLRRSIQHVIDRRFYRRKYDSARTLAAFGVTLRSETDLGALSERLVMAVQETMQPAYVSLWLRPSDHRT
jgi:hypothetical protein